MDENKKTGLGSSLLLQRTEESQTPERPDVPSASDVSKSADTPGVSDVSSVLTPKRPRRSGQGKPLKKAPKLTLRDRVTLYLDQDVNDQLDLAAGVERKERSQVVTEVLRKHLPKYRIEAK